MKKKIKEEIRNPFISAVLFFGFFFLSMWLINDLRIFLGVLIISGVKIK